MAPAECARFAALSVELSQLSTEFGNAVLDATDAWFEHVEDEGLLLDGLSASDKAMFADAARARGLSGWLVTLQMPHVNAVLTFAEDRGLRQRVYTASGTRASDQGPHAGRFDNSGRIAAILDRRREAARLLGFADPVEWSLATKMAPNTARCWPSCAISRAGQNRRPSRNMPRWPTMPPIIWGSPISSPGM